MKRMLLLGALLVAGSLGLQDASVGHGGTYRGPGDTVPPGGGGGGGGGGPATPGPGGPAAPGPSGPSTPGPGAPAAPGGGGQQGPAQPQTGNVDAGPDLTVWQFWWGFNKDPYLNLKAKIHDASSLTGSDDWFLGFGQRDQGRDSMKPSEATIREKIVPALVRALERETNNDIVTGAMIALAKIGDVRSEGGQSQFQQLIQRRLGDPNQEIRETAAVALGILADPRSIDLLRSIALGDAAGMRAAGVDAANASNFRTRAFAAYGLGLVGYRANADDRIRIVGYLRQLLEARENFSSPDIPVAAVIAMGLVPIELQEEQPPVDAKERADWQRDRVSKPDPTVSRFQQVQYLVNYVNDEKIDYRYRAHAPRAIGQLLEGADPSLRVAAGNALLNFIGRNTKARVELRMSAALAMGQVGRLGNDDIDKRIRTALQEAYGDAHQQVRSFSLISMAQIAGRPGQGEGDPYAGYDEIKRFLLRQLAQAKGTAKPWVGLAMGVMERSRIDQGQSASPDVIQALRESLRGENGPANVGAYALGAGIAGDGEASSTLLSKLGSINVDETRGEIAVALGLLGDTSATEPIQRIIGESQFRPELLKEAAIALGLLGDKKVVDSLMEMLKNAKSLATQAAIASALGFIGDARSVDPLVEMLENQSLTARARAFAAVALGIVADKEPLPWNSKIGVNINYRANTVTLTGEGGTGILDIL